MHDDRRDRRLGLGGRIDVVAVQGDGPEEVLALELDAVALVGADEPVTWIGGLSGGNGVRLLFAGRCRSVCCWFH